MPYKIKLCGIYRIANSVTGESYVGQSRNLHKRIKEHFRLLRRGTHPNCSLQTAYVVHGPEALKGEIEVLCESPDDLDSLEEAFLQGEAWFGSGGIYNISSTAHAPMTGRFHSEEVRKRIRFGRRASTFDYRSLEYRDTLRKAQMARYLRDPKFLARLKYILENEHLSYAERGRFLGIATTSVRKLALKHQSLKGTL